MEYKRKYREMDDATKAKISQSLKGRSKSFSHVENIKQGLRNYWKSVPNKPTDENRETLAKALDVSEAWLDGYDVPINESITNEKLDEIELLYKKYKSVLTADDVETMKFLIHKRIKKIDEQNNK